MIDHNGAWLPSVSIWLPVLCVAAALLLVANVVLIHISARINDWSLFGIFGGCLLTPALLFATVCPAVTYWPYKADYHKLQPVTGVIQKLDDRMYTLSQYIVVTFTTGLTVRCDDSRCVTLKVGDNIRLLCTKEHQNGSPYESDGWGCRWGQR